ncbi:MAG: methyltransferase domain-containing protein [Myxococcales bacterium]|nr:MAG: methyltransferase domain-containing protein [Myxococcales bacterium]
MDAQLFKRFCHIAYDRAGIFLKDGKEALVSARVAKRLRALGMESISDYIDFLENDETGQEVVHFLDVISTNFTHFMREPDHFDLLREKAREWAEAGVGKLRLWSAASSSGEEPYSIAITLEEALAERGANYLILATDISTQVLARARNAVYKASTLKAFSKAQIQEHFLKRPDLEGDEPFFEVKPNLKEHLVFKRLNLSKPPFPMSGPMDVVFCRNVMIYFDQEVRQRLVSEAERLLKPGGLLMIGHTETLTGVQHNLKPIRPSVFVKRQPGESTKTPERRGGGR